MGALEFVSSLGDITNIMQRLRKKLYTLYIVHETERLVAYNEREGRISENICLG